MANGEPSQFSEDVKKKAEWFNEIRGHLSEEELSLKYHGALAQIEVLREAGRADLDPGGDRLRKDEAFTLTGAGGRARAAAVQNPYAVASKGFATECIQVERAKVGAEATLKLRPLRGSAGRLELRTAKVFVFDARLRRWNLVEHSGYNASRNYLWTLVHRDGVYAAIALPKDPKAARRLGLERFTHYHLQYGMESGILARRDDYFDKGTFRVLATQAHDLSGSQKADRSRLAELTKVYQETRSLRQDWRRQLPNGGLPEWHLIEHWADSKPSLLRSIGLEDLTSRFPFMFSISPRVGRWFPHGPWNVNGRVKSIAIHPSNGSILYAGAADGGVWRTTDGGGSWRHLWTFEDSMSVGSVAIVDGSRSGDPQARRLAPGPDTIYAATGEDVGGLSPAYGGVGVYKSTDGGSTWTQKGSAAELGARCSKIVVHPSNSSLVYLASENGVHRSVDGGDTWTTVLGGHATDLVMPHDHPDTLYAGIWNDGLHKTTDGGNSWPTITSDVTVWVVIALFTMPFPTGGDAGWIKLAIGRNGPHGSSFVIAKLGAAGGHTYATFDGGASWGPAGGTEAARTADGFVYDEWTSMVAIDPKDPRCLFLGGVNLQYTDDGFNFHLTSGTHSDHHQVVFHPADNAICYCCCDGGVYKSTDHGVNWALASYQLTATQLMSLGVSRMGSFLAGSATQDQGVIQTDGSMVWDDFGGGNEWGMFVVDPNDSRRIYISPGDGELRCSSDSGHSYTNPTQGLTDPWPSQGRQTKPASFAHVAVRPGMSNFLVGCAFVADEVKDASGNVTDSYGPISRIYYSRDWGQSWWNAHTLPAKPSRVAYAPSDDTRAYAATVDGHFYRNDGGGQGGWYKPLPSTPSRMRRLRGARLPQGIITCITVDHYDADRVYVTYGDVNPHVYLSTDGGHTWASVAGTRADLALPDIAASALEIDPENPDVLYVGTDIGVFRSNDAGVSWFFYNDSDGDHDLPKLVVTGLGLHPATGRLFASTMGRGLYYTYTSGFLWLRVLRVSHRFRGRMEVGIQSLEVSDGAHTYIYSRSEVIRRIEAGTYVYTVGADGSRAEVLVMDPDNEHPIQYLKTTPDVTMANNLDSLPKF